MQKGSRAFVAAAFAARLNAIMAEQGLNQSQVAAKMWRRHISSEGKNVAVGRDRLSVWCAGKSIPSPEHLAKLAKELGVKPTDLIPEAELNGLEKPKIWMEAATSDGHSHVHIPTGPYPNEIAFEIMQLARKNLIKP